ncbi:MAG TPA: hypothetical protein VIK64_17320, partial [Anaerolineales bacterium]
MRTFGPVTLPESPSGAEGRWLPAHSAGVAMEGYGWQAQKPKRSLLAPGRAHPQPLDLLRQALLEGHTGREPQDIAGAGGVGPGMADVAGLRGALLSANGTS